MPVTPVLDKTITRQVQDRIAGRGLVNPCRVAVATMKGQVMLTGTVQYSHQKTTAVTAARGVSGVRGVSDQITVKAVAKF